MRPRKTFYRANSGNVSKEHQSGRPGATLWEKGKAYSETYIAKILDEAYLAGARDALAHVEDAAIAFAKDAKG